MMKLTRKYIQFNDLVIDSFDMLADADLSGGFKTETTAYSFGHGSYVNFKNRQQFSEEQTLSLTIKLDTRKLDCSNAKFYKDFVYLNLVHPGKLWAVQGEELLWTNAFVQGFSEPYGIERYMTSIDLDLVLYEGVWHKADTRKVFLKPYNPCIFDDCLDFRDVGECLDCCGACNLVERVECPKCACQCEFLNPESSLCVLKKEATNNFYNQCGDTYQIIYNCEAGKDFWKEKMLGEKVCKADTCKGMIAGQFYSNTVLDSENIIITLKGYFINPKININGNMMVINGEYDGTLTLTASGDVYYRDSDCCVDTLLPIEKLVIPQNNTLGYIVHQGMNSLVVETGDCCRMACAYIKVDAITI